MSWQDACCAELVWCELWLGVVQNLSWVDRMRVVQNWCDVSCDWVLCRTCHELTGCALCRTGAMWVVTVHAVQVWRTGSHCRRLTRTWRSRGRSSWSTASAPLRPRDSPTSLSLSSRAGQLWSVNQKAQETHPSQSGVLYEWGYVWPPPPTPPPQKMFLLLLDMRVKDAVRVDGSIAVWAGEEA